VHGNFVTVQHDASKPPDSGIVWLASYPKSGNTWTRAFLSNLATIMAGEEEALDVNSINRFTLGENSTHYYKEVCGFEPKANDHRKVADNRHRVQGAIADQFEGLIFCKTHNALVIDRGQSIINFAVTSGAIYIVRNPLDVAISLSYHMHMSIDQAIEIMATRDLETPINETRVHEVWGSWSQHVESWTRKPHRAIYVMRYEEMLTEPKNTFGELAHHLLLNPTAAELDLAIQRSSFDSLRDQEGEEGFKEKPEHAERFFREGRAGQWMDVLTPQQVDTIISAHGEQMRKFGYFP
jgi:hypothetical protein